ncbi:exodeoxyribonuclease III, putative [Plasmodium reichenowi]|uniref:Exodeoxyribonuclease III, putative n=1 Tax=Plasmodium reichenowi TaxID=5854 RepID=A0A151L4T0_PLARE|nr:exodeoxyribonuclease III, putative [Plasmodium reichenowi]KYN93961.1 exodeoxyribonuclease III, putative [Plasmodium reichenowi]
MEKIGLASWNVNGWKKSCEIIKRNDDDLLQFLKKLDIDILCLQETKTNESVIENDCNLLEADSNMYESYWTCCKKKKGDKTHKGYSGLATYVKNENKIICSTNNVFDDFSFFNDYIKKEDLLIKKKSEIDKTSISFFFLLNDNKKIYNDQNIKCDKNDEHNKINNKTNISVSEFFNEGRILITMHKHFIIVNIYAPYSGHNYERLYYKIRFFHAVRAKILQLRIVTGLPIILLGDFNISYRNKDIYYLNNIINLDILLKNINNIDLKEDIKMKIIKNVPLIINTLKDENNFIIKKYKIQNNELYNLYLKVDTHIKFIGNNFSSVEEILYFFSLDPVYVHDKYKDYPYEYYFVVNNVSDDFHDVFNRPTDSNINVSNNKNDHHNSSNNKCCNFKDQNENKENTPKMSYHNTYIKNNINKNEDSIQKKNREKEDDEFRTTHKNKYNFEHNELLKRYENFSINNEKIFESITNNNNNNNNSNDNEDIELHFLKKDKNIKYNNDDRNKNERNKKILNCKKILCKYKYKNNINGQYMVKNSNCIYLKHLNDIFISLNIILSEQDLLNIANSIGEPSSPPCCVDIIKNLIYEDNMIDTFSFFHPNVNGKFTCWDTYRQCRVHNEGSRIDYIFMDYILYEHFIKRNSYLYESPVILNDELYEMLKQKIKKKNSLNYDDMNSFQTNQYYANYFNKIKTKQKYLLSNDNINDTLRKKKKKQEKEKEEEQDEHKLEDQIQDAEFYKFQFKISTYIGFIYTSPKLSDHIAVKCTFIKNYNVINYNKKNKIIIKLCSSRFNIILNYLCTSINQYIMYLPLFLINPSLFSLTTYTLLDHVHLYDGLCPNILNTQPHKKTNKITQYFTLKKKK